MSNLPYDPAWPEEFERIRKVLELTLGDLALGIEHVGSTAVPGLSAKPRLDIDVIVESEDAFPEVEATLGSLGYFPQGALGRPGRLAFGRKDDRVPYDGSGTTWIKQNLYVCPQGSLVLREHLLFRDALRADPDLAERYARLKADLSARYRHDQAAYVEGKSAFVQGILESL